MGRVLLRIQLVRRFVTDFELKEKYFGILLVMPVILLFLGISVFPILYGMGLSLFSGVGALNLRFVGIENYRGIFSNARFWFSVQKGVIYGVYTVVVETLLGVAIALVINKKFKFANFVRSVVLVPYLIPSVAVAVIWRWLLQNNAGVLNYYLIQLNLIDTGINYFTTGLAMHTVVWVTAWKDSIFVVLIVLARLQSIDQNQYEMAKINGAGYVNRFFDVTLPNIKTTLMLVILLRSIWSFSKFDFIWVLTRGGPFDETLTMVVLAYKTAFQSLSFGEAAAITTVMFFMVLVVSIVYFRVFSPEEEVDTHAR